MLVIIDMCITFGSTIDTNNKKQLRVIESIVEVVLHHGRGGVIEQSFSSHREQTRIYVLFKCPFPPFLYSVQAPSTCSGGITSKGMSLLSVTSL